MMKLCEYIYEYLYCTVDIILCIYLLLIIYTVSKIYLIYKLVVTVTSILIFPTEMYIVYVLSQVNKNT